MKPGPHQPKPRTMRSKRYLAFLRRCACSWCRRAAPSDPAHMGGGRGTGTKGPDDQAVSLCRRCHRYSHDHGVLPKLSSLTVLRPEGATLSGESMREWARGVAEGLRFRFIAEGGRW